MILPMLAKLQSKRIILASGSPRRKNILENIGLSIEVVPSTFEENLNPASFNSIQEFVIETSSQKAQEVHGRIRESRIGHFDLIIAADTVVTFGGTVFGKPGDEASAKAMLNELNGQTHEVLTGVTLLWDGYTSVSVNDGDGDKSAVSTSPYLDKFCEKTEVKMAKMTDDIITAYVATQEPRDKAGAYGIQGLGGTIVEAIVGDYYNVVGFPLHRFCSAVYQRLKNESRG